MKKVVSVLVIRMLIKLTASYEEVSYEKWRA